MKRTILLLLTVVVFCLNSYAYVQRDSRSVQVCDSVSGQETDSVSYSPGVDEKTLQGIEVVASNVSHMGNVDKITITSDMLDGTKDAGRLLGKIQGLHYDPVSKAISYLGSGNVKILVDSIAKDESYIKRLRPQRFDYVSITHNPAGEYRDYEIVINLHTRPDYKGYDGNVGGNISILPSQNMGKGHNITSSSAFGDATLTYNKLTVSGNINHSYSYFGQNEQIAEEYPLNGIIWESLPGSDSDPTYRSRSNHVNSEVTFDYELNKNHKLSLLWCLNYGKPKSETANSFRRTYSNGNTELSDYSSISNSKGLANRFNLYYKGSFKRWNLNIMGGYVNLSDKNYNTTAWNPGSAIEDNRRSALQRYYGTASLSTIAPNGRFGFSVYELFSYADFNQYRIPADTRLSNSSEITNNLSASASYMACQVLTFGGNLGIDILQNSNNDLRKTFVSPRFTIWGALAAHRNLFIRTSYQTFSIPLEMSQEQDYGQFVDMLKWRGGNPSLKPSQRHFFDITFTMFNMLSIRGSYSKNHNAIYDIATTGYGTLPSGEEGYYARYTYDNGDSDGLGIVVMFQRQFLKHFSLNMNAAVNFLKVKYKDICKKKVFPSGNFYLGYTGLKGNLNAFLSYSLVSHSGQFTPQRTADGTMDSFYAGIRYEIPKTDIEIGADYLLPLHIVGGDMNIHYISDPIISSSYSNQNRLYDNTIKFSVVWRFRGGKNTKKLQHEKPF